MTPAEILAKAADVIETRGHHKGHYTDAEGQRVCAIGAMCVVAGLPLFSFGVFGHDAPEAADVFAAIDVLRGHVGMSVPAWNDAPERMHEEVVTALREAANAAGGAL